MTSSPENQPRYEDEKKTGESGFWLLLIYLVIGFIVSLLFWGIAKVPYWRLSFPLSCLLAIPWWRRRMYIEDQKNRRWWYQDQINLHIFVPPVLPLPESTSRITLLFLARLAVTLCAYIIAALIMHLLGIHGGPR